MLYKPPEHVDVFLARLPRPRKHLRRTPSGVHVNGRETGEIMRVNE